VAVFGQFAVVTEVRVRLVPTIEHVAVSFYVFATAADATNFMLTLKDDASVDGIDLVSIKNDIRLFAAIFGSASASQIKTGFDGALGTPPSSYFFVSVTDLPPQATLPAMVANGFLANVGLAPWGAFALRTVQQFIAASADPSWRRPKATRHVFLPFDEKVTLLAAEVATRLEDEALQGVFPACQMSMKVIDPAKVSPMSLVRIPRESKSVVEFGYTCLDDGLLGGATDGLQQKQRALQNEVDAIIRPSIERHWGLKNVKAYAWNDQWECWHDHFDNAWSVVVALKERFDPCAILGRGTNMFPQQRTRACSTDIEQTFTCAFGSELDDDDDDDDDDSSSLSDTIADSSDSAHYYGVENVLNVDHKSL
jgi:FAD/FMN-containing dehydrogenase